MTTTATQGGFLEAIRAEPDCDDHRLIYADWLQDHGDEALAEFIRVQCRIAHLDMGGGQLPMGVGREAMLEREKELWNTNEGGTWLIDVPLPNGIEACIDQESLSRSGRIDVAIVRRGFVAEVRCQWPVWKHNGPALVEQYPIEWVGLTCKSPVKGEFSRQHHSTLLAGKPFWRWDCELWQPEPEPLPPYVIPHEIYTYLDDYVSPEVFSNYRQYLSERDARDALSRACLAWAHAEAKRKKPGT